MKSGKSLNGTRPALGPTQPPSQWGSGALSPGVKRPGHEANHSPPASVEFKIHPFPNTPTRGSYAQGDRYSTDSAFSSIKAVAYQKF
jgi:hypothetical protein